MKNINGVFARRWCITLICLLLGGAGGLFAQGQNKDGRRIGLATDAPQNTRRLALVLGNSAYKSVSPLKNPVNDATDMAAQLRTLGFEVMLGTDLEQREMKRLIREFGQKLKGGGAGLFYYAGHGVQLRGFNYLVPVNAEIASEADIEDLAINLNLVLNLMDEAGNDLNMVILDACRNNPFARSVRSAADGLAQVDAPTGTLIAYSTAPGRVAADGTGRNGAYTEILLKQMRVPGVNVLDMFQDVRAQVVKQSAGKQVPWESSSLVGRFYFAGTNNATVATKPVATVAPNPAPATGVSEELRRAEEKAFWESALKFDDAALYQEYLDKAASGQFSGLYSSLARARLAKMRQPAATVTAPPPVASRPPAAANPPNEVDLTGNWLVQLNVNGQSVNAAVGFRKQGANYIGLWILPDQSNGVARNIVLRGNLLEADMCDANDCSRMRVTVQGDSFRGTLTQPGYPIFQVTATRVSRE